MKESCVFKKLFRDWPYVEGPESARTVLVPFYPMTPHHTHKEKLFLCADQNLNLLSWFIHSIKCTDHLPYVRHCTRSWRYNSEQNWQKYLSPWNVHSTPTRRMKPFTRQWEMQTDNLDGTDICVLYGIFSGLGKGAQGAKLRGKKKVRGLSKERQRRVQKLKALRQDSPALQFCWGLALVTKRWSCKSP